MEQKIDSIRAQMQDFSGTDAEEFKRLFTAKKGAINALFEDFKALPGPE